MKDEDRSYDLKKISLVAFNVLSFPICKSSAQDMQYKQHKTVILCTFMSLNIDEKNQNLE